MEKSRILFEDNHLIIVNKECGEAVQGDITGDVTLCDKVKEYLKEEYKKKGNVFLGIPHRIDRPTSGAVVYCKTSKALSRVSEYFRNGEVRKIYYAIVDKKPDPEEALLTHYLIKDEKNNKSRAYKEERKGAKKATLKYKTLLSSDNYHLLEIEIFTGRHHQIRAELSEIGLAIKGDVKYGAARANKDGGISLHARRIILPHPVKDEVIDITAPLPKDSLWLYFDNIISKRRPE